MSSKLMEDARQMKEAVRKRMQASGATRLMGFSLEVLEKGRAVMRMDVRERHKQIHGVVHGGVLATLADTTAALAAYSVLRRGRELATIELKINYMLPIADGHAIAEGRVLRAGRNFIVTECEIRTRKGELAAKALLTFGAASGKSLR
ncbi:MAG TPA: PaaI family thioesterase [Candidatus Acidoferrales bacterium]|nr:PaaI family thioesterase [Candidatus Acidoferrales bacterium]